MEDNKEMMALLERLEKAEQKQVRFARLQCIFGAVAAVCCLVVVIAVLVLLPQAETAMGQVNAVLENVEQVSQELAAANIGGVLSDLEVVAGQMAQADLAGIADDVSELVRSSQTGVEDALGKLGAIDLDTLNKAIQDLATVVEPLANMTSLFRK